jgi:hypothetical protein
MASETKEWRPPAQQPEDAVQAAPTQAGCTSTTIQGICRLVRYTCSASRDNRRYLLPSLPCHCVHEPGRKVKYDTSDVRLMKQRNLLCDRLAISTAPASRLIDIEAVARKHDCRSFLFLRTVGNVRLLLFDFSYYLTLSHRSYYHFVQASIHHSIYTRIDHPLPTFRFA